MSIGARAVVEKPFHKVLIGIGSNVGDRVGYCCRAVEKIRHHPEFAGVRVSSFYETDPVGITDQSSFINLVLEVRTSLSPKDLLKTLKTLERAMGRVQRYRWGPREVDLDVLLYGDVVISTSSLKIPHPEMHKRPFVLVPACDLCPEWEHPVLKISLSELLASLPKGGVTPYQGSIPCV